MIPAAFEYHAPTSIAEASNLLVQLGDDAKVLSGYEACALSLVELVIVIVDSIFQFFIAEYEMFSAIIEPEFEEVAFVEERSGGADEQISAMLRSQRLAPEANGGGCDGPLPTELRVLIV